MTSQPENLPVLLSAMHQLPSVVCLITHCRKLFQVLYIGAYYRACLDQHLIAIRSREVLGDHMRSKTWVIAITLRWSAAIQTRPPTTDTSAVLSVNCWCQQLQLIPWYRVCQAEGWESREQQVSGRCLVRRGTLTTDGGQSLMTHIRLNGDDAWCVNGFLFPVVTH